MKAIHKTLTAMVLGALLTGAAFAQTANTATGSADTQSENTATKTNRGGRHGKLMKELNLTDEQKAQMKQIRQDGKAQAKAIKADQTLTADQKKAKMKELHEQQKTKMDSILTADQKQKMEQWKKEHKGHRGKHRSNGGTQTPQ